MKTILLLAGQSTRFWPITDKHLVPLCGKPLFAHQIDRLRRAGCKDLLLVVGKHNKKAVQTLFPKLQMVEQKHLHLGMCGALLSALPLCGAHPVMIVGGSDVVDPEAYKLIQHSLQKHDCDGALLTFKVDSYFPGGYVVVGKGRKIQTIIEKPPEGQEPSNIVNIVVHGHRNAKQLLKVLRSPQNREDNGYGYESTLHTLFKTHNYRAVSYKGLWQPLKYPWHLLQLLPTFLREIEGKIHPQAEVHPSAVIEGPVILEKGVQVFPHASIRGPCYIGEGSIIANNALVRSSSVGRHCVVGFQTEIKASLLCDHVWTHMDYIGDSVIGENTSLGAGSITGNLRLDEGEIFSDVRAEKVNTHLRKFGNIIGPHARLGVGVSTNPGIKIGGGVFVNSKIIISQDIPDESFVSMKEGYIHIQKNRQPPLSPDKRRQFWRDVTRKS